jgi:sugar transferase (PEP-CTERM/EpsH1 system associated)
MKVMHVVYCLDVGGLETFVVDLAQQYAGQLECTIACLTGPGDLSARFHGPIHYLYKREGIDFRSSVSLYRLIKQHNPDLIHTHNQAANLYASLAAFMARRPVVYTKHGRSDGARQGKMMLIDRLASGITDHVVCVSNDVRELTISEGRLSECKVSVIGNGINVEKYGPQQVTENMGGGVGKRVVIGCVARLAPEKDHHTLLASCKILRDRGRDLKVVLVGDGVCRGAIESYLEEHDLKGVVELLGTRHDVAALLSSFDVFAMTSLTEGMSLTLLEAMAAALPVVTTSVGGNPEVVTDGVTGFLVPPQSPLLFADKLEALLVDGALRTSLGSAGRSRVVRDFSLRITADRYLDLYRKILGVRCP